MMDMRAPYLLGGSTHGTLLRELAQALHVPFRQVLPTRFPDGEMHVSLQDSVRGEHVFVLQPTSTPCADSLLELLLIADACRRAGARELTALIPYFAYARQERRARGREAVGAKLVADLLAAAHVDRVVSVDVHAAALEGFFSMPFENLTAFPLLLEAVTKWPRERGVVVAPDFGAAKLAQRLARALGVPAAYVHKQRLNGSAVEVQEVTGEIDGRVPLIVDDMISTGGTIEAAARALLVAGCVPSFTVVVTHGLFVGPAAERLGALPNTKLIATDTVPVDAMLPLTVERVSIAPLLARAVEAVCLGRSLQPLLAHA